MYYGISNEKYIIMNNDNTKHVLLFQSFSWIMQDYSNATQGQSEWTFKTISFDMFCIYVLTFYLPILNGIFNTYIEVWGTKIEW